MIIWPIVWFFWLFVIYCLAAVAVVVAITLFLSIRKQRKNQKTVSNKRIAVSVTTIVISFLLILNIWSRMSELAGEDSAGIIIEDTSDFRSDEVSRMWYYFRPFGDYTDTVSADFEPDLTITRNFPRLDGATAFLPVYSAVVETIYRGPDARTVSQYVRLSTTRQAFRRLTQGEADIVFTLQPSQAQIEEARALGIEFIKTPIFREAFVFFVNEENPITDLTVGQIQQIYTGEVTNWRSVGGNDEIIAAYQRNAGSGSQTIMEQVVMEGLEMIIPDTELRPYGMNEMLRSVSRYGNHERALGYSFRFYTTVMNPQDGLRLLSVDGIAPTPENIANGSYPFIVNVYAITTVQGLENPNTSAVIKWLLSEQGQRLIELAGYIPLGVITIE